MVISDDSMKTRLALLSALLALFWIATAVAMAGPDHPHGWPNRGVTSPGNPIHGPKNYASPGGWRHP